MCEIGDTTKARRAVKFVMSTAKLLSASTHVLCWRNIFEIALLEGLITKPDADEFLAA
jgi:hypothetical protein